jgi:hypothetical protein
VISHIKTHPGLTFLDVSLTPPNIGRIGQIGFDPSSVDALPRDPVSSWIIFV